MVTINTACAVPLADQLNAYAYDVLDAMTQFYAPRVKDLEYIIASQSKEIEQLKILLAAETLKTTSESEPV